MSFEWPGSTSACSRRWGSGLAEDRRGPQRRLAVAVSARLLRGSDLVGEHVDVKRAGRLVLIDVLAIELITLDEIPSGSSEPARPAQPDLDSLLDHMAPEISHSGSTHDISLGVPASERPPQPYAPNRCRTTMTLDHPVRGDRVNSLNDA